MRPFSHQYAARPSRLLLAALLAFGLQACGGDDPDALVAQAQARLKAGDVPAALILLKNAVVADERHARARFELGRLYLDRGDAAAAEKELRRAREAGYEADIVTPLIARALLRQGEFQRVLDEFPLPADTEPASSALLAARADAALALGDAETARRTLARVAKQAAAEPAVKLAEARLALNGRKPDEALAAIDAALAADPVYREAWLFKGELLRTLNRPADAVRAYRAVLEFDPGHVGARLALADLAITGNRLAEARKEVDTVLAALPNHALAQYAAALIDFREKKTGAARDRVAAVLKAAPDYGPAQLLAGHVEYTLGHYQTAEAHLNKAAKIAPGNPEIPRLLAAAQLRLGRPDEARRTLAPALRRMPDDTGLQVVAGEIALAQQDYAQAAIHYEAAVARQPDNAALRTQLGIARLALDDPRAAADLRAASAMAGSGERADTVLLLDQLRRKQYAAALTSLAALEKKSGPTPRIWNYRGAAQIGLGDPGRARASFGQALRLDPAFFPAAANLAQLDLRDKQPAAARKRFEEVLKARPDHLDALLALARLAQDENDEKARVRWLEQAARAHPGALEPRIALAGHLLAKGEKDRALVLARETYDAHPGDAAALELLGTVQLALGDAENALGSYRKLAEQRPGDARVLTRLATAQIAHKDDDDARSSLLDALRRQPGLTEARVLLAGLETRTGHHDQALAQARLIQRQHPALALGHALEGDIESARRNYDAALAAYTRAGEREPSGTQVLRQFRVLVDGGRREAGEQRLTAWLNRHPDEFALRAVLAESLLTRKQYAAAVAHYLPLSERRPDDLVVLNNLAWAMLELGDPRALSYAERALRLRPTDPRILDTHGWILVAQGQAAQGLSSLREALSRAPADPEIQYHLAVALYRAGEPARARGELERLFATGARFPQESEARALHARLKAAPR